MDVMLNVKAAKKKKREYSVRYIDAQNRAFPCTLAFIKTTLKLSNCDAFETLEEDLEFI